MASMDRETCIILPAEDLVPEDRDAVGIGVWVQKGTCELAKRLAEDNLRGWLQCWFGNLLRTSTTKPKGAEGQYTKMFGSQATT